MDERCRKYKVNLDIRVGNITFQSPSTVAQVGTYVCIWGTYTLASSPGRFFFSQIDRTGKIVHAQFRVLSNRIIAQRVLARQPGICRATL